MAAKKNLTSASKKPAKKAVKAVVAKKSVAAKKIVKKTKAVTAKKTKKIATKKVSVAKSKTLASSRRIIQEIKTMPAKATKKNSAPKEPTWKKALYMFLSIVNGLLLGMVVYLFVELVYIKQLIRTGQAFQEHILGRLHFFLPLGVVSLFLLVGLALGIRLGCWGWKLVYVERKHRIFKK